MIVQTLTAALDPCLGIDQPFMRCQNQRVSFQRDGFPFHRITRIKIRTIRADEIFGNIGNVGALRLEEVVKLIIRFDVNRIEGL